MAPESRQAAKKSAEQTLAAWLAGAGGPLVLDGATGTELERAGLATGLPLWSTRALLEAPECVLQIHAAYLQAGAEIVTANTFRTQRRALARGGLVEGDARLTRLAVELARLARSEAVAATAPGSSRSRPRWIAGSLPPLEDCYRPDLVPPEHELAREHERQADLLCEAGADLILVETMNSRREARIAARAAAGTGLPFAVSFVAWDGDRLLSGEPLAEAAAEAAGLGALAVGVNCLPIGNLGACHRALVGLRAPLLVSPNLGQPEPRSGFARDDSGDPLGFPDAFEGWLGPRAVIAGGCCGTTPAHIAALVARIDRDRRLGPGEPAVGLDSR